MTSVSVVIPYYNRAAWLEEAVASVLAQTLDDFEIIIVDDGSVEEPRFLAGLASDSRVRLVRQEHAGASAARNRGMRLARGRYVAFLDADDLFLPDKLRVQVDTMDARPDIALSHTSYRRMDAAGNDLESVESGVFSGDVYPQIVTSCPIATPTVMLRTATLLQLGAAFDETMRIGEDTVLWIDFARHLPILGVDRVLTKVRLHGRNASTDPLAQYRAGRDVLRRACAKDAALGFGYRRWALAGVCASAGWLYREQGQRGRSMGFYALGFVYWPLHDEIRRSFLRPLLPGWMRRALRPALAVVGRRKGRPRDTSAR